MTGRPEARRPGPHGRRAGGDAGMTLVELLVAMGIFTTVLAIFLGGLVVMTRGTVRADVIASSGDSVRLVVQRLERQVRYAEAVNLPGQGASGAWYVEFRTGAAVSSSGAASCTQWRWDPSSQRLQTRTWRDAATATVPDWTTVITGVLADSADTARSYPFDVALATSAQPRQRLTLRLTVGNETAETSVDSETTFVARNSSTSSVSNTDADGDGQSDTQVCVASAGRP